MRLGRLVATVALVLIASAALAEVKWEQYPADPSSGGGSCMSQLDACGIYTSEVADDFLCGDGFPITAVEWWGSSFNSAVQYRIRFYSDVPAGTGGIAWSRPGDLLYDEVCSDFTAVFDPALNQYRFSQDLEVPFCQELGTTYWFSVVGDVCSSNVPAEWAYWCHCGDDVYVWNDEAVQRGPFPAPGIPDWTAISETGFPYKELAFVLHGLSGNVICDPDPLDLVVSGPSGTIDVKYLGCGSGLLYGYSVTVTWDETKATLTGITEGNLLSDAGGTTFFYYGSGGTRTIDGSLMGGAAGVTGPGTLFTLAFDGGVSGTSTVVLDPVAFRDSGNNPLSGFYVDHGWINADVAGPVFTDVSLANLTLGHTDDYAKNTDNLQLMADVTDDYSLIREDIVADLSGLISGGGTAVVAQFYSSGVATWTAALANVTLTTDGLQSVTVTATDWLGNSASDSDGIIVDNTLPGNVTGFAAAPAHEEGILSWTDPTVPSLDTNYYGIVVQYDAWGDYPFYATSAPAYPASHTAGDGGAFDGTGAVTGAVHVIVPRDIHYYSAFAYDWALNYGGVDAGGQDRCTNYWLGDVATTLGVPGYNGLVNPADIDQLGGAYAIVSPTGTNAECNVGPTDDHSRVGIPLPHDGGTAVVDFEDLMIFSMNYGVVSAKVVPFLGEPGAGDLALALVENGRSNGGVLELALRLEGNVGDVKGLTAELEFDGLEFLSARLGDEMSSPMADVFFWSNATSRGVQVDAAVLGTDVTIGGSGDVVLFTFQVLDDTYSVDFASAELRGAANEDLTAELEGLSSEGIPVAFKLLQNAPNPFNPVTKVAYHVPSESHVTIRVFDVTGRLVTTLVDGVVEPGRHAAVWNGTNDRGESVGSGVYFCTMETPDYSSSQKMTLLK